MPSLRHPMVNAAATAELARLAPGRVAVAVGTGFTGRFVLGHLAYAAAEWEAAKKYLDAFVKRTESGREATRVALAGELRMARATLAKMRAN